MDNSKMRICLKCGTVYVWQKSPSNLKMTYCGIMCERADLGFTIDSLLHIQRKESPSENIPAPLDNTELVLAK